MKRLSSLLDKKQSEYIESELRSEARPRLVRTSVPIHEYLWDSSSLDPTVIALEEQEVTPMYTIAIPMMTRNRNPQVTQMLSSVLQNDISPIGSAITNALAEGKRESIPWLFRLVQERYPILYKSIAYYPRFEEKSDVALSRAIHDDMSRLLYNNLAEKSKSSLSVEYLMNEKQKNDIINFWNE